MSVKPVLLLCTMPALKPVLTRIFEVQFKPVFAVTLAEAREALAAGVDAVGCGIYFADGQGFELLKSVKADPALRHIPFFMAYGSNTELGPGITQGIEIATRALGGDGFVPMTQWRREFGDEDAFDKMRAVFSVALSA